MLNVIKQNRLHQKLIRPEGDPGRRAGYNQILGEGHNVHVSVGGLDSITLLLFLRSIGLDDVPAISVSALESVLKPSK